MVIMVDYSFNYHSLSLTIMFPFKWFTKVDASWQNHANMACPEVSNFGSIWDFTQEVAS